MEMARRVVLLVDGHADSRDVYRAVLQRRGYMVIEAEDAESGWQQARLVRPDVVITEVSLREPALGLLERLKSDPQSRDVPVIVLTTQVFPELRARAQAAGCAGFLAKPLEPRHLLAEIEALLGPAGEGGDALET